MAAFPRPVKSTNNPIQTALPNDKTVFAIDDGTREITLVNKYNQVICKIHFRTSDFSILDRFKALQETLPSILEPLSRIDINPDGTNDGKDAEAWAILKKAEGIAKEQLNILLDMNEADKIFKTRHPFSSVGGKFFLTQVIEALGKAINAAIEEEAALMQKNIAQYTDDLENEDVSANAGAATDNA